MRTLLKNSSLLPIIVVVMMSLFTGTMNAQVDVMTIKGASITIKGSTLVDKTLDAQPNIYVGGDVTNDAGTIDNAGELQFTGSYILNNSATHASSGDDIFIGALTGTPDAIYNKLKQTVTGNSTGGLNGIYGFYNLILQKPARTTTDSSMVELGNNVDVKNSINWTGSGGGIIRTDLISHATDGSAYVYAINLTNGLPTAISGNSWVNVPQWSNTGGARDKYIEGKLQRFVNQIGTYQYPIGTQADSIDGMEGAEVSFTSAPSNVLLGYIQPATNPSLVVDLITNGEILFYDIGSLPGSTPSNQFPNCVGTPDGHDDIAVIDQADKWEWIFTLVSGSPTVAYNLRVHPGSVMDNLSYVAMGTPCNSVFQKAKYLARNGRIGGDQAVGPTTNYWNPGVTGLYQKPTGNIITGQTGFSRFRLFGTTDPMNTSLPVELLTFTVRTVNNEYLRLDWATASELNNAGFAIERSTGNSGWTQIGWVNGNGNSNSLKQYTYDDRTVSYDTIYYYRLKQTDFSGAFHYSWISSGKLIGSNTKPFSFSPNPTTNGVVTLYNRNDSKIILYDVLGKLIKTIPLTENQFDISELANGTYYMRVIDTNDKSQTYKLLKIK